MQSKKEEAFGGSMRKLLKNTHAFYIWKMLKFKNKSNIQRSIKFIKFCSIVTRGVQKFRSKLSDFENHVSNLKLG